MLNRNLARASYLVGFALILIPVIDAGTSILPLRFGESRWRYGSIGLLSNSLLIPLAGVATVFAVANAYGHRRSLRALGAIAAVSCLATITAIFTFALDALQSQGDIRPELHVAYIVGTTTALGKLLVGAVAFALFALAGLKRAPGEKGTKRDQILVGDLPPRRKKADAAV